MPLLGGGGGVHEAHSHGREVAARGVGCSQDLSGVQQLLRGIGGQWVR